MAKLIYEVYQNQNEHSAAYGKWYARTKSLETLTTRKLAAHISEHGSIFTPDIVYGVLEKFRSCLVEMLLNSKKVKIEGLGTFYCTLECTKGGSLKKEDFNVASNIEALHIRFLPETAAEQNISSKEFLKQAEFINIEDLLKKEKPQTPADGGDNTGDNTGDNSGDNTGDNTGDNNGGGGAPPAGDDDNEVPGEG